MTDHPDYLAELVHWPESDFRYTNALSLGAGGVWIDPNEDAKDYTWIVKLPADITQELVRFTNPEVTNTNFDLELAALVIQETAFCTNLKL